MEFEGQECLYFGRYRQLVKTIDVVAGDVIDFSNFSGAYIVSYGGKSEKVIF